MIKFLGSVIFSGGQHQMLYSLQHTVTSSTVGKIEILTVLSAPLLWKKWSGSVSRGDRLLCLGRMIPSFDLSLNWARFRRQGKDAGSHEEVSENRNIFQQASWKTECLLNIQCISSNLGLSCPLRVRCASILVSWQRTVSALLGGAVPAWCTNVIPHSYPPPFVFQSHAAFSGMHPLSHFITSLPPWCWCRHRRSG